VGHGDPEVNEVYRSDAIDLSDLDLASLDRLPSAALRAAVERIRRELHGDGERSAHYAGFRSSLRASRHESTRAEDNGTNAGDDTLN
jgi:FXSXX-COOH protein